MPPVDEEILEEEIPLQDDIATQEDPTPQHDYLPEEILQVETDPQVGQYLISTARINKLLN